MARAAEDKRHFEETAEMAAELAALERMLELSAGTPSLSTAICNSPALRDYLIERVCEKHPDLVVISLPSETIDVYGYVEAHLEERQPDALFVAGIEHSVHADQEYQHTLKSLNASRDLWEQRFHCPVVFWMPSYVAGLFALHGMDFWRYRSHRMGFDEIG